MITSPSRANVISSDPHLRELSKWLIEPLTTVFGWLLAAWLTGADLVEGDLVVCVILFLLTFPGRWMPISDLGSLLDLFSNWLFVLGFMALLSYGAGHVASYDHDRLLAWALVTPLLTAFGMSICWRVLQWVTRHERHAARVLIVGVNETSRRLAEEIAMDDSGMRLIGFLDDRNAERLGERAPMLGRMADVAACVKAQQVQRVYIALPMASQPRVQRLLDELNDTTAAIYFVPDFFTFDLIQARVTRVQHMPVLAVCESPFYGYNLVFKRISDVLLASFFIVLLAPLMLLVALAIKLDSKGPVIFRQRRYGMDGCEIMVWKFRTMTVMEDGDVIRQARHDDERITRIGRYLRRSSIDELPQFFNVLGGSMSVVGPRPHAVAHNEAYRKLIKGYMMRHMVKPGITGWAQVNGFRGETETLEKMARRVEHDLEYLRNWSLRFDLAIVLRTPLQVLFCKTAY